MAALQQNRTVYLATHCVENKTESFYTYNLAETVRLATLLGIELRTILINDTESAVVAKNEILSMLIGQEYESVVFLGHNMSWDSTSLMQNINSTYDSIGLPCAKKSGQNVVFDLEIGDVNLTRDDSGFIKVNYASFSCLKLSNKVVTDLLDTNKSITNPSGREVKNVFENSTINGRYLSEDRVVCEKIKKLGYNIWINPVSTCANIAGNVFAADLATNLVPQDTQINNSVKTLYQ